MTDKLKIMTDNEIIKAFKDFLIDQVDGYTDHVETGGERYEFIEKELELLKETDNLINRLQAENERLTDTLNATIAGQETLQRYIITAKSEAYKEFAERLKEKSYPFPCAIGVENAVTIRTINDLLEEMESEQ